MNKKFILGTMLLLLTGVASAQEWDFGAYIGPCNYQGDLSQKQVTWSKTRPSGGIYGRYNYSPKIAFKVGVNIGWIAGDDQVYGKKWDRTIPYGTNTKNDQYYERRKRNLNFHSHVIELTAQAEWNLLQYIPGSRSHRWTPYLLAGFSVFHFDPKTELNGTTYKLRKYETEENKHYSSISFALPVGGGVKFNLGSLWSVGIEIGWRKTFTDYLDDVSKNYPGVSASAYSSKVDYQLSDRSSEVQGGDYNNNPYPTGGLLPYNQKVSETRSNGVGSRYARGDVYDKDTYVFTGITITKTIRKYACNQY